MPMHIPIPFPWWQLGRGRSAATKRAKPSNQEAPSTYHAPQPSQTGVSETETAPPAYEDIGMLPYLQVGLRREDEVRILGVVDCVIEELHAILARRDFDRISARAVASATRQGCISAAVAVCKTFEQKTTQQLNNDVDEGCRKVGEAVMAASCAAPNGSRMGTAEGVVSCIKETAHHVMQHRKSRLSFAAASQLVLAAQSVATTICVRILDDKNDPFASKIPLPPRAQLLSPA